MINKQNAKQAGVKIVDSRELFGEGKTALLEQLKALLPAIINSDNQLDSKALRDVVDVAGTTSNNQGYELTFAGKGLARAEADTPTEYELKTERGQSKDFDETENVVIRGDNIDVLKILYQNYHGKIKMIYIDPPYNTKSDNFIYKDNFKQSDEALIDQFRLDEDTIDFLHNVYGTRSHSGWLSFMYPRLKLARELLAEDGVIFISIDDNEQANLKLICDEIFGEENFVANFVWNSTKSITNPAIVSVSHTHNLTYAKQLDVLKNSRSNFKLPAILEGFKNHDNDPRGPWKADPFEAGGVRPNQMYPIKNPTTKEVFYPAEGNCWKNDLKRFKELVADNRIVFGIKGNSRPQRKRFLPEAVTKGLTPNTWWDDVGTTTNGTMDLKVLLGANKFQNPKPASLICKILRLSTNKDAIILDFFAGSGTTADAIMQLNAEDGGNRKFILVQWDEAIDKKKNAEAYNFCTDNELAPVISSITIERLNRAGEKIKSELKAKNKQGSLIDENKKLPDIGYKVFSIHKKPRLVDQDDADATTFSIYSNRKETANTLFNMLSATCKPLHCKMECLIKDVLYRAEDELYLLANVAEEQVREKLKNYPDLKINLDGWADINLEQYLNLNAASSRDITVIY